MTERSAFVLTSRTLGAAEPLFAQRLGTFAFLLPHCGRAKQAAASLGVHVRIVPWSGSARGHGILLTV